MRFIDFLLEIRIMLVQLTIQKGVMVMKIKRVFDQTTGFDYVMKAFIESKLDELIDEETDKRYNVDNTTQITPRNEVTL